MGLKEAWIIFAIGIMDFLSSPVIKPTKMIKLTDAAWLRATPGAIALAQSGRRADQDEGRGAAEGHFRLVDETSSLPETADRSSRVAAELCCTGGRTHTHTILFQCGLLLLLKKHAVKDECRFGFQL